MSDVTNNAQQVAEVVPTAIAEAMQQALEKRKPRVRPSNVKAVEGNEHLTGTGPTRSAASKATAQAIKDATTAKRCQQAARAEKRLQTTVAKETAVVAKEKAEREAEAKTVKATDKHKSAASSMIVLAVTEEDKQAELQKQLAMCKNYAEEFEYCLRQFALDNKKPRVKDAENKTLKYESVIDLAINTVEAIEAKSGKQTYLGKMLRAFRLYDVAVKEIQLPKAQESLDKRKDTVQGRRSALNSRYGK